MADATGMSPLPAAAGLAALLRALAGRQPQCLVLHGDAGKLQSGLFAERASLVARKPSLQAVDTRASTGADIDALRTRLADILARRLKMPPARLDAQAPIARYGVDSIMMMALIDDLETHFGPLPKTLLFEYGTLADLAGYFAARETGGSPRAAAAAVAPRAEIASPLPQAAALPEVDEKDIAIIGLSGRYPQAATLDDFLTNLRAGRDCIQDIPPERWDVARYFDARKGVIGRSYCKWGGFLDDVAGFDAELFNISPRDAAALDPQCRIMLEQTWALLENGGYTPAALRARHRGRVGVWVGSMYQQYRSSYAETHFNPAMLVTSTSAMANRISNAFGFEGPSVAVDTMCSSSAVAIHQACQSLRSGECSVAVAGGVNLSIHPYKYIGLSQWQLLGSASDSRSFGAGDGYLPAEGAGLALLKPLRDALRDGDTVLAVIRGSAFCHSGGDRQYMQPNMEAQIRAMTAALENARLSPRDIGYVEAAANGGAVSDAVEALALAKVFSSAGERIPLGSVKAGIGHAEAASAMSQLSKVVFQLRRRELLPTLAPVERNPHIDFAASPFRLQTELADWRADAPRRALINSFGAGGSYVSLVLEEAPPQQEAYPAETAGQVIVLSARSRPQLDAMADRLLSHLERHPELPLAGIAYTLQTSRQALPCRLAWAAHSPTDVIKGLQAFLAARRGEPMPTDAPALHQADRDNASDALAQLISGDLASTIAEQLLTQRDLARLALLWAQGGDIPWARLHPAKPALADLPNYPFARQIHWVELLDASSASIEPEVVAAAAPSSTEEIVREQLRLVLGRAVTAEPANRALRELGFHSLHAMTLKFALEQALGEALPIAALADPALTLGRLLELAPQSVGAARQPSLQPRPEERFEPFPLTDIQESFLVGRSLGPAAERVCAHIYLELELGNRADPARLTRALNKLIARHGMLRAVIDPDGRQRVLPEVDEYRIRAADLRRLTPQECEARQASLRAGMTTRQFDAAGWPRFEARLTIHPDNRHVLHFGIDELIVDGPSLYQLLREWAAAYAQPESIGGEATLTFRDYVFALKTMEDEAAAQQDLAFWMQRLDEMPAGPALPAAAKPEFARVRLRHDLTPAQFERLKKRAAQAEATTTSLLLTLFCEVLAAWSDHPRFTLILTHANRLIAHPELASLVGPALSTHFFVAEPLPQADLAQLIRARQNELWQALDHLRISGVRVLRELKLRKQAAADIRLPVVFTSMLNSAAAADGQTPWPISHMLNQTPQVLLDHQLVEENGSLQLSWDVAIGYYAPGLIEAMFDAYRRLIEQQLDAEGWQRPRLELALAAPPALRLRPDHSHAAAPFPLSDQQLAYAFGRSGPNGSGLSCQYYQELEAEALDVGRLERAWASLMAIHPMLRAVIGADGTQRVQPAAPNYAIRIMDCSRQSEQEREQTLATTRREMVSRNAPLDGWPFFELRVSHLPGRRSRLHAAVDMLIADGRSIMQLLNQLLQAYQYPHLPLTAPQADFRAYRMAVADTMRSGRTDYWKEKFAALPKAPPLPRRRAAVSGDAHHRRVEGLLYGWPTLCRHAESMQVAPDAILLAAYLETLSAWSQRQPLAVVAPNWDRLATDPPIDDALGDFTALAWVAHDGAALPFERRVRDVAAQLSSDLAQRPLSGLAALRRQARSRGLHYPVVFTSVMPALRLPDEGEWSVGAAQSKTPGVHLDNISVPRREGLHCAWDYLPSEYEPSQIEEMFQGYMRLLTRLADDPAAWGDSDADLLIRAGRADATR
ncbi:beta-ketoacyl synthase N-terminal-like domain-containing protein [Chromobacterium alticapitis]|nr:beta-ketoacyl synthase N-terminal-like domain-containing protein [Chromobacterium alticapitis]